MRIYIDTSGFIALASRRDKNHFASKEFLKASLEEGHRFVTGKNVLIEYIDGLTKRATKRAAIHQLDSILSSRFVLVEDVREEDWSLGLEYLRRYSDKTIDLTDSLSFAIMERLGIDSAFAFDRDFEIHGFLILPS
ncbi:MAG: PIN domain-containing protein [Thermoplasmata archaeon]